MQKREVDNNGKRKKGKQTMMEKKEIQNNANKGNGQQWKKNKKMKKMGNR